MHQCSSTESSMKQLLCPKPRRVCPSVPEFLKQPPCRQQCMSTDIVDKGMMERDGRDELGCCGPLGSPPGRSGNPLIHDLLFIRPNFSTVTSASSSPDHLLHTPSSP